MAKQLTPWFPARVKPTHQGVYEVKAVRRAGSEMSPAGFAGWDGARWGFSEETPAQAALTLQSSAEHAEQGKPWRGLAEAPK